MTPDQRTEMINLVRAGHDQESAAAELNVSMSEVREAGHELAEQLREAFAVATGRIRAKLLKVALTAEDMRALSTLLAHRETQIPEERVTNIERVVVSDVCPNCGYRPRFQPESSRPDVGRNPDHPTPGELANAMTTN